MDADIMDDEQEAGRLYRPLNRTPPEYQTVIKFLLMASILDSVWVSGPPQEGSACGLVGSGPGHQEAPVDDIPALRIPLEVRESLRQLNISAEDCSRHPDELRLGAATPTVVRVLSLVLFNAFVVWSDFGAALLGPVAPAAPGLPRWLDAGSGVRSPDIALRGASAASYGGCPGGSEPWTSAPACLAASAAAPPPACPPAAPRTRRAAAINASAAPKTSPAKSDDLYDAQDFAVPWFVQLFYVVTLVLVIVGSPCCPVVFENACTFLMC
ncbi:hypothetical protein ONE63_000563 [Megalurothrips usitatus]|uniref:Uncharacterized protein n=1 Tax=Megalurothrips usitatus TaxID=439358 RepID=A0AAV7XZD8_9NEOP|nr:hypothetical protein ONE63_000563 [Megalurothrips usitatus]